jgi:hypothetical protein
MKLGKACAQLVAVVVSGVKRRADGMEVVGRGVCHSSNEYLVKEKKV